jgi:hydrogenase maturation protease
MNSLIIGYGNTLRGDDAVGFRVAEALEKCDSHQIKALPCHQLTPELAADIAEADQVIFVDATPPQNPHSPILVERITPSGRTPLFQGHHSDPAGLLALTHQLYGKQPIAYIMLLPSWEMGYSEDLSRIAKTGMKQGLRLLRDMLNIPYPLE